MSDGPQYPSYPGDDDGPRPEPTPPPGWGQAPPPPSYGQAPPPPSYGQAPPGYGQAPPGYGQVPPGYFPPHHQPPSSTKAVWGLVLGIVSILFCYLGVLIGPAAIIVSVMAGREIDARPPGAMSGKGMATAGLVTGIIGTVVWGAIMALTIVGAVID